jgi:transcriptional regulator with XRE-family HTH domain
VTLISVNLVTQFGRHLAQLRSEKRLTQEQLAEAANISLDFLSLIERGLRAPSFATIERLSNALGVEVKYLFDFEAGYESPVK